MNSSQNDDLEQASKEMSDFFKKVVSDPLEKMVDAKLKEIMRQTNEITNIYSAVRTINENLEEKEILSEITSQKAEYKKLSEQIPSKNQIESLQNVLTQKNLSLVAELERSEANRASAHLNLIEHLDSAKQESERFRETAFATFPQIFTAQVEKRHQDSKKMIRVAIILGSISVALSLATILLILTNFKLL